jgi:hypothetical protein
VELLETKATPQDLFAAQGLMGLGVLGSLLPVTTPTQVLLQGHWPAPAPAVDPSALGHSAPPNPDGLHADRADAYFASLSVIPSPDRPSGGGGGGGGGGAEYEPVQPPQDIQAGTASLRMAIEAMLRPPGLDDFLGQVAGLQSPLPATADNTGLHDSPAEARLGSPPGVEVGSGGGGGSSAPVVESPGLNTSGTSDLGLSQPFNRQSQSVPDPFPVQPGPLALPPASISNPTVMSPALSTTSAGPVSIPVAAAQFSGTVIPITQAPLTAPARVPPPVLQAGFGNVPLAFEPNLGQASVGTDFVAHGPGYGIGLGASGITLSAQKPGAATADVLQIGFGSAVAAGLQPADLLPGRSNYFRSGANPVNLTDVPQYGSVTAPDVLPGVDVVYHGNGRNLQFDFHLHPGADPSSVDLVYQGAQSVSVDGQGRVVLHTPNGDVFQEAPVLYQEHGGSRQMVAGHYVDRGHGHVGFAVDAAYDHSTELVLDPTLSFSSYLGGSTDDYGYGIAVDFQGNSYLVGKTLSNNFPTQNPYQSSFGGGGTDAFISKFSPSGALVYSTFLGGSASDGGLGIAVDVAGSAYVTGSTSSSTFPITGGAYQSSLGQVTHTGAFVTKLSPAGNALVYSTFLSGTGSGGVADYGQGIAVDRAGNAYVTGYTTSTNFPTTSGAAQTNYGGGGDLFVTKLNPAGSALVFSTYLGGSGQDGASSAVTGSPAGIAVDALGSAYVASVSTSSNFPTTAGAFRTSLSGTQDAVVVKLNPSGSAWAYATYLGGSGTDAADAIAVDKQGRAYVTGWTQSTNFPTSSGAYQSSLAGTQNVFIARLNASGSALEYGTYLGGNGTDAGNGVAVDSSNNAYVVGVTSSTNFPTVSAYQSSNAGGNDAFVARLADGGSTLAWSSYLGGGGNDQANAVALDADSNIVLTGQTTSSNFPTASAFQSSNGGVNNNDAFVTRFAQLVPPVFTSISSDTGYSSSDQITTAQNLTLYGTALPNATITLYRAGLGQIGTTTASGTGLWTFSYTGTTLAEGSYGFTGTATVNGKISPESTPFQVTVDRTAPTVTLTAPATTTALKPQLQVTATDLVGLPATTTVTLDVDTNNDGNFTDSGETGYMTATMTNGVAVFALSPALAVGTVKLRARVTDKAGNEGTSATSTMVVQSSGSGWTITDTTPQFDPFTGDPLLQRGNLTVSQPLDLDQSPGTTVGGSPALVYSSERTSAKPIIQAQIQSDSSVALPSTITAQLTWNGTAQTAQTFNTTGLNAGDLITVAQQVSSAVSSTGRYTYTLTVTMNYGTAIVRSVTGATFVDVEDSSVLGAGWTLGSVDKLVSVSQQTVGTYTFAAGLERVLDSGGQEFFAQSGSNYTSPAGDNGTLSAVGSNYQYLTPDGRKENFNSSGQETSFVSPDGLATIAYSYTGSNLTGISTPDGALTTLAYTSTQDTIKTGTRTVTLTLDSSTNHLTNIANPDGGLRSLSYDSSHHLTQDQFGSLSTTYAYSNGVYSSTTPGDGGAFSISPQSTFGLSSLAAAPLWASVTDPLGRVTREQLERHDSLHPGCQRPGDGADRPSGQRHHLHPGQCGLPDADHLPRRQHAGQRLPGIGPDRLPRADAVHRRERQDLDLHI